MGQVIRKDAAVEDIIGDASTTLTNATARGGKWKDLAEQRLPPVLMLFSNIEAQRKAAEDQHAPHAAAIAAQNDRADKTIGKVYDTIWNEVGRPAWDASLAVIFPDGIAYYAEGDTSEQPDRMEILTTLLEAGIHPKLSKETAVGGATEIATEANALRAVVEAGRKTGAKVKVLGRVRTALGRVVQAELSSLKRMYKAEGFTETEIHAVIPDRPASRGKKAEG